MSRYRLVSWKFSVLGQQPTDCTHGFLLTVIVLLIAAATVQAKPPASDGNRVTADTRALSPQGVRWRESHQNANVDASPRTAKRSQTTARDSAVVARSVHAINSQLPPGGTVVKDHVTDAVNWDGGKMVFNVFNPFFNKTAAVAFTGNGDELSKVGFIWGYRDINFIANQGDPTTLAGWRFAFYNDSVDFSNDPFRSNPPQPNHLHVFNTPSNPDWFFINGDPAQGQNIVGHSAPLIVSGIGGAPQIFNLFYAELDVSFLHIETIPGQEHLISILPSVSLSSDALTLVSLSSGVNSIGTELDWFAGITDGQPTVGPDTILNLGLGGGGFSFAAFKVVTVAVGACCVNGVCQDNAGAGIDQTTCEQTLGGVFQGSGTTCAAGSCTTVPAASDWGVIVMALLILSAGTLVYTRRTAVNPTG